MDVAGVMAAYCARGACVYFIVLEVTAVPSYTVNYTQALRAEYAAITPTTSMSTDTIEPIL